MTSTMRASGPSTPSTINAAPSQAKAIAHCPSLADKRERRPSTAPLAVRVWTAAAPASLRLFLERKLIQGNSRGPGLEFVAERALDLHVAIGRMLIELKSFRPVLRAIKQLKPEIQFRKSAATVPSPGIVRSVPFDFPAAIGSIELKLGNLPGYARLDELRGRICLQACRWSRYRLR